MIEDFAGLLAPLAVTEFAARMFERVAVHVPGTAARISALAMEPEAIFALLDSRVKVKGQYFDDAGRHRVQDIQAAEAPGRYAAGWTICVAGIQAVHPGIAELARSARTQLGCAGEVFVNAYVSPAGQGFGLHFDTFSVFNVQLVGEKEWSYSRTPGVPSPPYACGADDADQFRRAFPNIALEVPSLDALETVTMRPGDLLYLPAGCWHRARAGDRSVALSLSPVPPTVCDVLVPLLAELLREDPAWRAYLPLTPELPRVGVPPAIEAVWSQRAGELADRITALVPRLNLAWRSAFAGSAPAPIEVRPISPSDALVVRQPASLLDVGDRVVVFAGAARCELPATLRGVAAHLIEHSRFIAGDAGAWETVRAPLQELLAAGVLGFELG